MTRFSTWIAGTVNGDTGYDELLSIVLAIMGMDGIHASSRTEHGKRAIRALISAGRMTLIEDDNGRVVAKRVTQ